MSQHTHATKQAEVFAIHGAEPEVLAYAMAKYSRSALSMKDAIAEISRQKAEEFLNTFYFQYGHRSIADLAHIPMAVENISLLAAIEVVDEQRWDGQERSTRYQDFSKREYYVPEDLSETESVHYHATMNMLFDAYFEVFAEAVSHFKSLHPSPPEGMTEAAYLRTINARAFDVARYLLPMATLTSVGQVTSARTLESQISRMLASPYTEVVQLGNKMRGAATTVPAFNPNSEAGEPVYAAPTLVKHAEANTYMLDSGNIARKLLSELDLPSVKVGLFPVLGSPQCACSHEVDILATILYPYSRHTYSMLCTSVHRKTDGWRQDAIAALLSVRGRHDELLRGYRGSCGITFDIVMDIGGMRDMHRHRRANQYSQAYSPDLGFATPEPFCSDTLLTTYNKATKQAKAAFEVMHRLREMRGVDASLSAYLLPLGTNHRFMMKMDIAEIAYIAELRTGPAGHISYRRVAWELFEYLQLCAPGIARGIEDRVTDPDTPLDFFKR